MFARRQALASFATRSFTLSMLLAAICFARADGQTVNDPIVIIDPSYATVSTGSVPVVITLCGDVYGYDDTQFEVLLNGINITSQFVSGWTSRVPNGISNCASSEQFSATITLPQGSFRRYRAGQRLQYGRPPQRV